LRTVIFARRRASDPTKQKGKRRLKEKKRWVSVTKELSTKRGKQFGPKKERKGHHSTGGGTAPKRRKTKLKPGGGIQKAQSNSTKKDRQ